jgi:hypothetical protein
MKAHVVLLAIAISGASLPAGAHDAPAGWSYDASCCSSIDCRQIPAASLSERPDGYFVSMGNIIVPYGDKRLKDSPDGYVHWCTVNGRNDGRTICLYVPPRSF